MYHIPGVMWTCRKMGSEYCVHISFDNITGFVCDPHNRYNILLSLKVH